VRLAACGINRSTGSHYFFQQSNISICVPLECIVVVIYKHRFGPTLTRHDKRVHNPIVSRGTIPAKCVFVWCRLMPRNGFINDINIIQIGITLRNLIKPFCDFFQLLFLGKVIQPGRILSAPNQAMKLERKIVILTILILPVDSCPIVNITGSFYRSPFRFIFRRQLIPIITEITSDGTHRGDVPQKFIRIFRQLGITVCATQH